MMIREYRPSDEAGWLRCRAVSLLDTSYAADVRTEKEKYLQPEISLVAEDDGQIIGLIDMEVDSYDLSLCGDIRGAVLWHLAVLPEYRRKGVASALWAEMVSRLRTEGVDRVEVWTQDDAPATAFYLSKGFTLEPEHTWLRCRANAAGVERMLGDEARDGIFGVEELVFNAPLMRKDELMPLCERIDEVRLYTATL